MEDITPIAAGLDADLALMALDAWDVIVHPARVVVPTRTAEPDVAALASVPQLVYEQPGMAVIA
jgi:hypothetical protein